MSEPNENPIDVAAVAIATACLHAELIALNTIMKSLLVSTNRPDELCKLNRALMTTPTLSNGQGLGTVTLLVASTMSWLAENLTGEYAAEQIGALAFAIEQVLNPNDDDPVDIFS